MNCRIVITKAVTLGDSDGPGSIHLNPRRVDVDVHGRFYVSFVQPALVAMYSPTGKYVGHIGSLGDGPGEYRWPTVASVRGDTVFIVDATHRRVTAVSAFDRDAIPQSIPMLELANGAHHNIRLENGRFVSAAMIMTENEIGFPLHIYSPTGNRLRSFGLKVPAYRPDRRNLTYRRLTPDHRGGFWAGWIHANVIEQYDGDGNLITALRIKSEWFPDGDGTREYTTPNGPPPPPEVTALAVDSSGLLWSIVAVADENWTSSFGKPRPNPRIPGGLAYPIEDMNRFGDTRIQVIDPIANVVLATSRLDQLLWTIGPGFGASTIVNPASGLFQIEIWRIGILRP